MARTARRGAKPDKSSSLDELRRHRIVRVKRQNEQILLDLKRSRGELVSADAFKAEVVACNAVVRNQLLGLAFRLAPRLVNISEQTVIQRILHQGIVSCLNGLAYEEQKEESA
jgi:hypothetical protein